MKIVIAVSLVCVAACGPQNPTLQPIALVGEYGVRVEQFASAMQGQVAASTLSNDLKAKAMVGFREVGVQIELLGTALIAYDVAVTAGQAVSGGEALALSERIKAGLLTIVTLVRGAGSPIADQVVQTFALIEQALLELKLRIAR